MKKKNIIILVCTLVILSLVISYAFMIVEGHHECKGEVCEICLNLEKMINSQKNTKVLLIIAIVFGFIILSINKETSEFLNYNNSLIGKKVRMNNYM